MYCPTENEPLFSRFVWFDVYLYNFIYDINCNVFNKYITFAFHLLYKMKTNKQNTINAIIPSKLCDCFLNLFHFSGMRTIIKHNYVSGIINECLLYPDKYKVKTDDMLQWINESKGATTRLRVSFNKTEFYLLEQLAIGSFRSNKSQLTYIISNFAAWASQNGYIQIVLNEDKTFSFKKVKKSPLIEHLEEINNK